MHLANASELLAAQVRVIPNVKEVQVIDNKLVINVDDPEHNNPEIIRTLVNAGAEIQFVGELRRSLEDVYLQLVRNAD